MSRKYAYILLVSWSEITSQLLRDQRARYAKDKREKGRGMKGNRSIDMVKSGNLSGILCKSEIQCALVEQVSMITRSMAKSGIVTDAAIRFFSRYNDREFVERNEIRSIRVERIRVDPLFLSSSSHCRVNRRSSIKILPGWTMSVPVKRNWSRLISKLDASSNAFSRGLQLTGRNNDSFNPVRQRVLKDGPSAVGHEMKRIYGNYKVYAASKPVESSYEFHWPKTAINENLLISRQKYVLYFVQKYFWSLPFTTYFCGHIVLNFQQIIFAFQPQLYAMLFLFEYLVYLTIGHGFICLFSLSSCKCNF